MSNESKSFGIIYCYINEINSKCYVGQTVDFEKRKREHLYRAKNSIHNMCFYNAIRKYGIDNFRWEILCECNSKEELNEMEKYYIKLYNTKAPNGYNLTDGGEGMFGFKHTDKAKKKMSESHVGIKRTDETKKKISETCKGNKHTDDTKKKISESKRGHSVSINTRKKISKTLKEVLTDEDKRKIGENSSKIYEITYPDGKTVIIKGLKLWCEENNLNYNSVKNTYKKNNSYKGYKIIKKDKE